MTEVPSVHAAWAAVMADVQAIRKKERNQSQGFNFRGIDTTVNAVGPALREHGVTVIPTPEHIEFHDYETNRGTQMRNAVVKMRYTIYGPAGDSIDGGGAYGEAADAGDKAVSKAQSVAYRVFLLQALTVPTDDPDPDSESHQRASRPVPSPVDAEFDRLIAGLNADAKRALGVWRQERGLSAPSQMSQDEKRMVIDHIKETTR